MEETVAGVTPQRCVEIASTDSADLNTLKRFWALHEADRIAFNASIAAHALAPDHSDSQRLASMKRKWVRLTSREREQMQVLMRGERA